MDYEELARKIVKALLHDLSDRSGFEVITYIEEDVEEEMYGELEAIVINILREESR